MSELLQAPVCEKCGTEKVWIKDLRSPAFGYWSCRSCNKKRRKEAKRADPERFNAYQRKYNALDPERRRRQVRESYHRQRAADPEKFRAKWELERKSNRATRAARQRSYRAKNPEKCANACQKWFRDNPAKTRAVNQRRRARKRNAVVPGRPVSAAIEEKRIDLFNGCCYCGAQKKLTLEHVVPLEAGGLHVEENLLGACGACNCSKRNRPVESWYRAQPFFSEQRWQRILEVTSSEDSDDNVGTAAA